MFLRKDKILGKGCDDVNRNEYMKGLTSGVIAFTLWGILPLYWRLVHELNAYQIFLQRVVWSFVFVLLILIFLKRIKRFIEVVKDERMWVKMLLPSFFVSLNWLTYIWAVNNGYVIETSLGYYINPLVFTMVGAFVFKEKLTKLQWVGIGFAFLGVLMKTITYGELPYIALILAITFSVYGVAKKFSPLDSLMSLGFETLIVSIPSFFILLLSEVNGSGITGNLEFSFWFLIALSGMMTATPLIFYGEATKKLPLNVVGFLQYIAPTLQLIIGVYVFNEYFDLSGLLSFGFIWIGIIIFTYSQYKMMKRYN